MAQRSRSLEASTQCIPSSHNQSMVSGPSNALIEVGFWRRYQDASIDPADSRSWPEHGVKIASHSVLLLYLESGFMESIEYGFAECRLCGGSGPALGCLSLTDGKYVWPEGLVHYLREHHIKLPSDFEAHAVANCDWLRMTHRFRQDKTEPLLEWSSAGPVTAQPETEAWVREHTDFGIAGSRTSLCCFHF